MKKKRQLFVKLGTRYYPVKGYKPAGFKVMGREDTIKALRKKKKKRN